METYRDIDRKQRARVQVQKIKSFYSHLGVYLFFSGFFIFLNYRSGGMFWAIFPIAGWGLGVLAQASDTFNWNPFFGKEWERRKIQEILEKERRNY